MSLIAIKPYAFEQNEQERMWDLLWCLSDFYNVVANVQLSGVYHHIALDTSGRCVGVK
jgi:hypothetical protein